MKYIYCLVVLCLLSGCTGGVEVDHSVEVATGDIVTTSQILSGDILTGDDAVSGVVDTIGEAETPVLGKETKTYAWIMKIYPKDGTYYVDLDYLTALTCRDVLANRPPYEGASLSFCEENPDEMAEGPGGGPIIDNQSKKIRTFALTDTTIQLIDTKAAEAGLTESGLMPVSAKDLYTALMIDPVKAEYHRGMEFLPTRSTTGNPNDLFRVVESADHRLLSLEQEWLP